MKLARFTTGTDPEIGIVSGNTIVPLNRAAPLLPADMAQLIAAWDKCEGEVRRIAAEADGALPLASVRLLAPVAHPGKIFAIGLNYADHIAETGMQKPEIQIWFTKAVTAVNAPFDPVQIPAAPRFVDYEVEMVAVIGKGGRHISAADAPQSVFGWCVGNDVTERMWQQRSPQWSLAKSFDTHAPFGPWITTSDEITDPHTLGIRCQVNGETRQNSNTRELVFNVWQQIAHLSQAMTLQPGDLLFTGTPGGVGAAMKPPCPLAPGDIVRCEIDGLGFIEATFAGD